MDLSNPLVRDLVDKTNAKSLEGYDVIGFDVDHCLILYNIPNLHKMTYFGFADTLTKDRGYPKSMYELTEEQLNFPYNRLINDFVTGHTLKLGADNRILRAYRGFRRISLEEVNIENHKQLVKSYGNPPRMKNFSKEKQETDDYFASLTYFDSPFTLLYAVMQDLIVFSQIKLQEKKEIVKSNEELKADFWYAHKNSYVYWDYKEKIIHPMASYGTYYPQVIKNPELYIKKREDVKRLLMKLREKGKKLFILTNSHYDYCDFIMTTSFGKDWRQLFDLCITCAKKPNFFKTETRPFFKADEAAPMFCGEEAKLPLELNRDYITGNYKDLERTFEETLGRKDLKYVYLGDNYMGDCYWTAKIANWDSIAIVEELSDSKLVGSEEAWGSHLFEEVEKGKYYPTILYEILLKDVKHIVPNINLLS